VQWHQLAAWRSGHAPALGAQLSPSKAIAHDDLIRTSNVSPLIWQPLQLHVSMGKPGGQNQNIWRNLKKQELFGFHALH
jgi:hypothetical protein